MPSSSTSNSPSPLSASELSELLRDDPMVNLVNQVYNDNAVSATFMRHYSFITMNIRRMRELLDEQLRERQEVFEHMMKDAELQEKLQPIVTILYHFVQFGSHASRGPFFAEMSRKSQPNFSGAEIIR